MSKLETTNTLIENVEKIVEEGFIFDNTAFLADIAQSLAMIADKLCEEGKDSNDE